MTARGVQSYSTTSAINTALFPEGMPPSAVNNSARQVQVDLAEMYRDIEWIEYGNGDGHGGGGTDYEATYSTGNTLYIAGDVRDAYHTGRRIRIQGNATGTVYGTLREPSYDSGGDRTLISYALDDGEIVEESGIRVWISAMSAVDTSFPAAALSGHDIDLNESELANVRLKNYSEQRSTLAITAGAITWDARDGNIGYLLLTENVTSIVIDNWSSSPSLASLLLIIQQDDTGGRTIGGWPGTIAWFGNIEPTITTAAFAVDAITLLSLDGGANAVGSFVQGALPSGQIG